MYPSCSSSRIFIKVLAFITMVFLASIHAIANNPDQADASGANCQYAKTTYQLKSDNRQPENHKYIQNLLNLGKNNLLKTESCETISNKIIAFCRKPN